MTISRTSYLHAAYPLPLRHLDDTPRVFRLRWNNSKMRATSKMRIDRNAWHEAYGVRFPNGRVALDFGPGYDMMADLEDAYRDMGEFKVEWLSDEQEAAQ